MFQQRAGERAPGGTEGKAGQASAVKGKAGKGAKGQGGKEGGRVGLEQFVDFMLATFSLSVVQNLNVSLQVTPRLFVQALMQLFEAADANSRGQISFEQFHSMIIHVGLSTASSFLTAPVAQYTRMPNVRVAKLHLGELTLQYLPEPDLLLVNHIAGIEFDLLASLTSMIEASVFAFLLFWGLFVAAVVAVCFLFFAIPELDDHIFLLSFLVRFFVIVALHLLSFLVRQETSILRAGRANGAA